MSRLDDSVRAQIDMRIYSRLADNDGTNNVAFHDIVTASCALEQALSLNSSSSCVA
jgi:hypothetical protein